MVIRSGGGMANDSTIGVGVSLVVITTGAMLVYTALHGKGVAAVLGGDTGAALNPAGGIGTPNATSPSGGDPSTAPDATTPSGAGGASGLGAPPLGGLGTTVIDGHPVANWIAEKVLCARAHGWTGTVTDGVRSDAEQKQACIHVCGNPNGCPGTCAEPGTSNHRGFIFPLGAVDVTDPVGFAAALRGCNGPRLVNALPADPVHFSYTGH